MGRWKKELADGAESLFEGAFDNDWVLNWISMKCFLKKRKGYISRSMEIENVSSVSKVLESAAVAAVKDSVTVQSADINRWVDELKMMAEIRPEKTEGPRATPSLDALAQAIAQEVLS